jgi:hypothetical protein
LLVNLKEDNLYENYFCNFSFAEKKYIIEHKDDYIFYQYVHRCRVEFKLGEPKDSWNELYVSSTEFESVYKSNQEKLEFKEIFGSNLFWGLTTLGLVSEDKIEIINTKINYFNKNIDKLEENLNSDIETIQEKISTSQKQLEALFTVKLAIHSYGGWDKFLEDYKKALLEKIKK